MKNVLKVSLLAALMLSAVAVNADDGNMSTGNKTCGVNCPSLASGLPTDDNRDSQLDANKDESTVLTDAIRSIIDELLAVIA